MICNTHISPILFTRHIQTDSFCISFLIHIFILNIINITSLCALLHIDLGLELRNSRFPRCPTCFTPRAWLNRKLTHIVKENYK